MLIDDKASIRKIDMNVLLQKISIEKQIINRELFFAIGFCPEIGQHLLCVHISWIAGYDRYYALDDGDVELYETAPEAFCKKYEKEIKAYRTKRFIGAGALRDYDFSVLPDEVLKRLNGYPSFKGYCYKDGLLYAQVKIEDKYFLLPPIFDDQQMCTRD